MADLSRLITALTQAVGLAPDVLAAVEPHVPPELADEWQEIKNAVHGATDPVAATAKIVEGLGGAFAALVAGHGNAGPTTPHAG